MVAFNARTTLLWTSLSDALDIPESLYQKAVDRHGSLGAWFCRSGSRLAAYRPSVSPQGSFRFGTVVRPIDPDAEYDLDHVVVLKGLSSDSMTQADLKRLHGLEIAGYATAHGMLPPAEHNRCWRARYRDEVAFHLDSLPCVPAGGVTWDGLRRAGVDEGLAMRAIAITDRRHPQYRQLSPDWPTSNPRGFARWFDSRAALGRDQGMLERIRAGAVEDVPPYEWRTPLQRSIQILKRHRDVMFQRTPDIAPISMIITNLAACAYQGETDLTETLRGILHRMPDFVREGVPRVPNPTHPAEDYADKWQRDSRLERSFWEWHQQAQVDVERFSSSLTRIASRDVEAKFGLPLTREVEAQLAVGAPAIVAPAAVVTDISQAPKPWGAPSTSTR
jgi:hypothetical protein